MNYCCEELKAAVVEETSRDGLYPGLPPGLLEYYEGWNVTGCCGGGCYRLSGIKFCPFCGKDLSYLPVPEN